MTRPTLTLKLFYHLQDPTRAAPPQFLLLLRGRYVYEVKSYIIDASTSPRTPRRPILTLLVSEERFPFPSVAAAS